MPKLLDNLEDRIFISAKELFYQKGYNQVSMRDISSKANIAVGTLYNYFSNKNDLYFSVLEKNWESTFRKLDLILERDLDEKIKLKTSISLIYEEILDRRCMGVEVRKVKALKDEKSIIELEKKIRKNIKKIFKDINIKDEFKDDGKILEKIVYSLLINMTMLIDNYAEEKVKNIEYLYNMILGFIE